MIPAPGARPQSLPPQTVRLLWLAFLCGACAIIAIAHFLSRPPSQPVPAPIFVYALTGVATVDIVFFGIFRRSLLERSRARSRRGEAAQAQATWALAQILGFAAAMSVVLFGFVLHLLGAQPPWISTVFFVAGLLNLAVYRPRPIESL
jgi:MFS family permease